MIWKTLIQVQEFFAKFEYKLSLDYTEKTAPYWTPHIINNFNIYLFNKLS